VVYNFKGGSDGYGPVAGLTAVSGSLYGISFGGTGSGTGVIFKMSTAGTLGGTFDCGANADVCASYAALLNVNGTLYDTAGGGSANDGSIFSYLP
jgi:hypothetical protein